MGCWGFGIMESDDALDEECRFERIAGVRSRAQERKALESHAQVLLDSIQSTGEAGAANYDYAVGHQVLAVMLMRAGCQLTEDLRKRLLAGIVHCEEYQAASRLEAQAPAVTADYARRLKQRRQAIDQLVAQLKDYDIRGGTPSLEPSKGLLEVIESRRSAGLVNELDR